MDKYEPIRILGEGSFGKVYLMRDKTQRKLLCVKIIKIKNIPKKERDATQVSPEVLSYDQIFIHDFTNLKTLKYQRWRLIC